jgi:hypothetical protein
MVLVLMRAPVNLRGAGTLRRASDAARELVGRVVRVCERDAANARGRLLSGSKAYFDPNLV